VWLVLEHKQLPYEFNLLSLQNGELKKPEYLAINPHGKVPALIDDDFVTWEASTIVEYLEDKYPEHPVFPTSIKERAIVRRLSAEAYTYLYPVLRRLMDQTLFRPDGDGDPAMIAVAINELSRELAYFEDALQGDYFVGNISAADFTIYPLLALVKRLHERRPQLGADALIWPKLKGFMQRIEQLPYFTKTTPPHWKG
jgi:glutathione S-transferase